MSKKRLASRRTVALETLVYGGTGMLSADTLAALDAPLVRSNGEQNPIVITRRGECFSIRPTPRTW